jgi:hypothetical protein
MRKIAERFPNAVLVGDDEFTKLVQGRRFEYHSGEVGITVSAEAFQENGRYAFGHRPVYDGTYSIKDGIVSLNYDSRKTFLGLGTKRIFFREGHRLFTASADATGEVWEMIPAP